MSERQARTTDLQPRLDYLKRIMRPGARADGKAWLAANSREGIRDEALRALREVGAVIERPLPKTSGMGRYSLRRDFADLFKPDRPEGERTSRISSWRKRHLTPAELARLAILAAQIHGKVTLPDGSTRVLSPGPSEPIIRGIIEQFAHRFLTRPVVLAYSDSANPDAYVNEELIERLRLRYGPGYPYPDVLLADVAEPLRFVFVEAVATEGPMDTQRVRTIVRWLEHSSYRGRDAYFVTAYYDRSRPEFRRTVGELAWNTAVWFVSEPDLLVVALDGRAISSLRDLPGWR